MYKINKIHTTSCKIIQINKVIFKFNTKFIQTSSSLGRRFFWKKTRGFGNVKLGFHEA